MPTQPANPNAPPLAQFDPDATPYGNISNTPGGVALTGINNNELVSYQLGQLQNSGNPLVQQAAQNANNFAAARGAGLSGSLYGQSATAAAFDAMTPIAAADAGQYAAVRDANQAALNQQNIERMGNDTSLSVANTAAGASMTNSANSLREARYEFDQGNTISQANREESRQWQVADQNTAARAAARSQFMGQAYGAVFSDPSFWKDPEGSLGMLNTYGSNIDSLLQNLFPEYDWDQSDPSAGAQAPYSGGRPNAITPIGPRP